MNAALTVVKTFAWIALFAGILGVVLAVVGALMFFDVVKGNLDSATRTSYGSILVAFGMYSFLSGIFNWGLLLMLAGMSKELILIRSSLEEHAI